MSTITCQGFQDEGLFSDAVVETVDEGLFSTSATTFIDDGLFSNEVCWAARVSGFEFQVLLGDVSAGVFKIYEIPGFEFVVEQGVPYELVTQNDDIWTASSAGDSGWIYPASDSQVWG